MNLNENSNVVLIETDNKVLSADLVNSIKKRFGKKTINKVLLIQPPDTDKKSFNYAAGKRGRLYNYPPYGLGLLATQLRKMNKVVDVLNLNYEILKKCSKSANEEEFDFDKMLGFNNQSWGADFFRVRFKVRGS